MSPDLTTSHKEDDMLIWTSQSYFEYNLHAPEVIYNTNIALRPLKQRVDKFPTVE